MMIRKKAIVAIALLGVGLAGCGSTRPSRFFVLEPPEISPAAGSQLPVSILVGRLTAPHIFRDTRIIYRHGEHELGTYETYRWAEPPAEMLESMLLRSLRRTGRFKSVVPLRSNSRGEFIVRGRLNAITDVAGPPETARLSVDFELFDQDSGASVWTTTYRNEEPVSGKDISNLVEAMNKNAQRAIEQAVNGINDYFAKHPPKAK